MESVTATDGWATRQTHAAASGPFKFCFGGDTARKPRARPVTDRPSDAPDRERLRPRTPVGAGRRAVST